ncbi:MAG: FAD-binding protein, partial [Actinobacteria bacterium]
MTVAEKSIEKINLITLEIDGKSQQVQKGTTILDAAKKSGINIPTLCHDERILPYGSCRVCLVEVEGARGPLTACSAEVAEGMKVTTNSEVIKELRKLSIELLLSNHWADCIAPCRLTCPAGTDAQGYIGLINQKRYSEAVKLIKETNPLPSTIGRICTRPCEDVCRRNLVEDNISICWLKRFVGDYDLNSDTPYVPEVAPDTGHKIAVIGAGPSGLSAAFFLRLQGHQVTIFEKLPKPGGMFRYGMPAYRLPKDILDKEVKRITDLGVEINYNTSLGKDFSLDDLFSQGYEAVFAGIGQQKSSAMRVE